jgi:hypothetical protein
MYKIIVFRATCKTAEREFIYGQIGQEKRKTPALK